jgi:26S proteasome regulatory subunit N2
MPGLVSATGVLGFLADEEPELKVFALKTLNDDIDTVWTEVAGALSQIEALYEDESFPERRLAALVLAKVYFHLQDYNESMTFALAAGPLFKLDAPSEFEETIISKCVDQYIAVSSSRHTPAKQSKNDVALPALATNFGSGSLDGSALISPTTPFSQSMLPSKSLLSRDSVDNTILRWGKARTRACDRVVCARKKRMHSSPSSRRASHRPARTRDPVRSPLVKLLRG